VLATDTWHLAAAVYAVAIDGGRSGNIFGRAQDDASARQIRVAVRTGLVMLLLLRTFYVIGHHPYGLLGVAITLGVTLPHGSVGAVEAQVADGYVVAPLRDGDRTPELGRLARIGAEDHPVPLLTGVVEDHLLVGVGVNASAQAPHLAS
jgi:hypothetical protein